MLEKKKKINFGKKKRGKVRNKNEKIQKKKVKIL